MHKSRCSIEAILETTGRFTIRRRLGAGGMGVVYEAYDAKRDAVVALKTLRRVNPGALYLFKREFRALADVSHPNLVTLYELMVAADQWFFTMERVHGMELLAYLRDDSSPSEPDTEQLDTEQLDTEQLDDTATATVRTLPTLESPVSGCSSDARAADPIDAARIRPILIQLVEGLAALHASGHLHCDLKPSNLLVTPEGRLVVLDYGVIVETTGDDRRDGRLVFRGTPAYTSPEQAAGRAPTPASDLYSVGTILYRALAGRRPFRGTPAEILEHKQIMDPLEPASLYAAVDPMLADLCMRLLARDPTQRPTASDVLLALGCAPASAPALPRELVPDPDADEAALVGRTHELAVLREAFDESRAGHGCVVRIRGRSGMGKTALLASFLADLAARDAPLVLAGRCYERESVPHQAVDGLVDALCQYLLHLPRRQAEALMPLDVLAMARAFPVLARVEVVAKARRRSALTVTDPLELRGRAFAALKELFTRIAERQPLVLVIDDLQWGDVDSAPLLADLLRAPAPPMMLVVSYRTEEEKTSPLLQALLAADAADDDPFAIAREILISRLRLPQACMLAESLLAAAGVSTASAEAIARESCGSPLFVHELVRYVALQGDDSVTRAPPLSQVLLSRSAGLSPDARQLLLVVAVAARPLAEAVARRAARLDDRHIRAIVELRTAHLVRTTGSAGNLVIETYHDRIREAFAGSLARDTVRTLHLRIAQALETESGADPEALALHYASAGESDAAREYARLAADRAADTLAFDRAATFYRLVLELTPEADPALRCSVGRLLGDALVNAGRGVEAPEVYLAAAACAAPQEARALQVSAGSELLRSGRVDEGIDVLRAPLASAGIALARSRVSAAASLLIQRAYARLRGLGFKCREVAQIAPATLVQIDACHAAAAGLAMVDPLRGAYVQTRHLMRAMADGDPFRIGRAMTYEGGFLCIGGKRMRRRVDAIAHTVQELVDQTGAPYLDALHHSHVALADYQCGNWRRTLDHAARAESLYRERCTGVAWELSSTQLYSLWSLFWLGEFEQLCTRTRAARQDAKTRGDLYASVCLDIGIPSVVGLVADDVAGTRRRAEIAARKWTHADYHLQHFWSAVSLAQCDLYAGNYANASERMEAQWPLLRRAFLLKVAMVRAETLYLRAGCAAAAAITTDRADPHARLARRLSRTLRKQDLAWCAPAAELLVAGLEAAAGRGTDAITALDRAETGLREADTHGLAAAARWRRGELLGGAEGATLVNEAETWLRQRAVVSPQRMVKFLAPGFTPYAERTIPGAEK